MVHKFLTDRTLQTLASSSQMYVWDMTLRGFGVRVGPHRKTFIVIRIGHRKTIGRHA